MKICFITFGCRLNRAEALEEEARAVAKGWHLTDSHAEADVIVVRGCSVTAKAQRDCEKEIAHLRRKYPMKRLIVCGCIEKSLANTKSTELAGQAPAVPPVPTRTSRAFLKVQDGCSGKCTFCIVPHFRGKSVSVPFEEVLAKAERFVSAGYHEIVVTGCNLVLYASGGKRLPDLVSALAELSPDCRIRLGSVEPGVCALETIAAMAEHPSVCRFLHLAVQSGSNRILSAMQRPYSERDVEGVVARAKKLMPVLGLGCDVIAGFPGEGDLDHIATKGLLERLPFNKVHVFPYSTRPGTKAATFQCSVPHAIRSARAAELERIVDGKRGLFARSFIGHEVEIVVEEEDRQAGWTAEYLWCEAKSPKAFFPQPRKHIARFLVEGIAGHRLIGRPLPLSGRGDTMEQNMV